MNGVHLLELHEFLVGALPVVAQCVNVLACEEEKGVGGEQKTDRCERKFSKNDAQT